MSLDLPLIAHNILAQYKLSPDGVHGVAHWARVLENGRRLAATTGADLSVVNLFALFHDSRRVYEGFDVQHGQRGATLARELRGQVFDVLDQPFKLLCRACEGHSREHTHPDITIQTCWDADRLDLGRVGITPHPNRLCTASAKEPAMIQWAHRRAIFEVRPDFVKYEWEIELA